MTILIFIIILLVLVIIHEGGHFFAGKISKVRVDEFAFGFPPRLFSVKKGETRYSFNALPLGGYVKMTGENGDENNQDKRSFANKRPLTKIFILAAGVIMNLVLAYFLITISTYINTNIVVDRNSQEYNTLLSEGRIRGEKAIITNIVKDSPASLAGLKPGDKIIKIYANQENASGKVIKQNEISLKQEAEDIVANISKSINDENNKYNDSITIIFQDIHKVVATTTIAGVYNLENNQNKKMIGLSLSKIAEANLSFTTAIKYGFEKTVEYTKLTVVGFKDLIVNIVKNGEFGENVAGPIGIVHEVGNARELGFNYLLLFTAILSISLAIFNILPIPALDGGRILFVLIEWISGKKIKESWQNILNLIGFSLLILLMIFVSIKDVLKLF